MNTSLKYQQNTLNNHTFNFTCWFKQSQALHKRVHFNAGTFPIYCSSPRWCLFCRNVWQSPP